MTNKFYYWLRPFEKIAGWQALGWGVAGIALASWLSWIFGVHFNSFLQVRIWPGDPWWTYVSEHLIIWLVPALLFYLGGLMLSPSRIRPLDVIGTLAFAQLPVLAWAGVMCLPPVNRYLGRLTQIVQSGNFSELAAETAGGLTYLYLLGPILLAVWMLVWMFNALKVSCNLKKTRLAVWYGFSVLAGDVLCRILIGMLNR